MKELQVLKALYKTTDGDAGRSVGTDTIAQAAGLSHRAVVRHLQDLVLAGYAERADDGVRLTAAGVRRVEYTEK